jgi:hypothetical protein
LDISANLTGYELDIDLTSSQSVTIQRQGQADGLPDVQVQQHGSATFSELRLYQFDGTHYRLTKCMDQSYASNTERLLEKPIITEKPCD